MPAVIRFHGYPLLPESQSLGKTIRAYRPRTGTTQKHLATILLVDTTILAREEGGKSQPMNKARTQLKPLLADVNSRESRPHQDLTNLGCGLFEREDQISPSGGDLIHGAFVL